MVSFLPKRQIRVFQHSQQAYKRAHDEAVKNDGSDGVQDVDNDPSSAECPVKRQKRSESPQRADEQPERNADEQPEENQDGNAEEQPEETPDENPDEENPDEEDPDEEDPDHESHPSEDSSSEYAGPDQQMEEPAKAAEEEEEEEEAEEEEEEEEEEDEEKDDEEDDTGIIRQCKGMTKRRRVRPKKYHNTKSEKHMVWEEPRRCNNWIVTNEDPVLCHVHRPQEDEEDA